MNDTENLKELDREQLDARALEVGGIPDPTLYSKKGDLQAAVEASLAGEPIPEPKVSGATVTFTGAEDENVRTVLIGDTRFVLDVPTHGVDQATVKAARELEDHEFEVD